MRRRLALLAVAAAGGASAPVHAQEPAAPAPPVPGPFMAASMGGGSLGDVSPGLTGGGLGLRGHLEVGYGDGRYMSGALAVALGRTSYDNNIPPPEMVLADADLDVNRLGFGVVGEGRLPLGRVTPILGAGAFLDRMSATASGALLGIRGDYYETTDIAVGVEARAGLDIRVHEAVEIGARAGWHFTRTNLAELTGGSEWLSGPWLELRVTFDASGFRMAPPSSRRRR